MILVPVKLLQKHPPGIHLKLANQQLSADCINVIDLGSVDTLELEEENLQKLTWGQ